MAIAMHAVPAEQPSQPRLSRKPALDWDLEADLRHVERLLASVHRNVEQPREAAAQGVYPDACAPHHPAAAMQQRGARTDAAAAAEQRGKTGFLAAACLLLGVMAFVCGGVLLGWSVAAKRNDLWSLGLPLTLGGQAGLIIGLILQLDGLWQTNRRTEASLSELDQQLAELRHNTALLGRTHSGPAQSFYAHLASGATSQMLLADLKGQLDLLAQQMANSQRRAG